MSYLSNPIAPMKSLICSATAALSGLTLAAPLALVPLPVSVTPGAGTFDFSAATAICFDPALKNEADLLAADLQARTAVAPKTVADASRGGFPGNIGLAIDAAAALPAGGYKLDITPAGVVVTGKDSAGVFYGTRTMLQLLPPLGAAAWQDAVPEPLPVLAIVDHPRFVWRGMMLDVARHFYPPDEVKRLIDWMAFHKLNVFHWHLTDDQGWRIEIKQYPKLTQVGAWRDSSPPYGNRDSDDGQRYGGFYTQAQIKEVVAYAAARHITIVPEIEMPGHAAAAITAYPELGNTDVPGYAPKVVTRWGVYPYIFSPQETTLRFLENVLGEVCELFPSKFIHIGGDEAPKDQWRQSKAAQEVMRREGLKHEEELQGWFVRRIGKFLETKNRRLIGWDEIQEGGLSKTATMMVWRDAKWAKHALALGNDVVMATTSHNYFDYYQAPAATELAKGKEYEAIGGLLPLDKVYSYNPTFVADNPAQEQQILGTQAQLWSEYLQDMKKVEYMAFPRLAALAETAWTPHAAKNYDDFRRRLDGVMKHYDGGHLNYAKPAPLPEKSTTTPAAAPGTSPGVATPPPAAAAALRIPAFTAYLEPDADGAQVAQSQGITGWHDAGLRVSWFGELKHSGKLTAALALRLPQGRSSNLQLTIAGQQHQAVAQGGSVSFGDYQIDKPGYVRFELSSLNGTGDAGTIEALVLEGPAVAGAHFNLLPHRNAASVHLNFPAPADAKVAMFYNEVTAVEDPQASFYMACGFSRGYFGMQVNSATERQIIFSVWDAGSGQSAKDRSSVAAEEQTQLLAKGEGVVASVFGNEGTGGHSHLVYPWQTGQPQRFVVTARPDGSQTIYSGFWYHPEKKAWVLIASFRAPKDGQWLRGLHSFSENFNGNNGQLRRKALFGPQWIALDDGKWIELTHATFSHDGTGAADRLDRFMGVEAGRFFLSQGGFVPGCSTPGEAFTRPASAAAPPDIRLPAVP
jgi:hexosaminidase